MSGDDHNQAGEPVACPCSVQTRHEAHFYQSAIFGVGADGPVPTLACACPGVSS